MERRSTHLDRSYFVQVFKAVPLGVGVAAIIFMLFPRIQHSSEFSFGMGKMRTGYSGTIQLGGGGEIAKSSEIAFRVASEDLNWLKSVATELHYRGTSLDYFDGQGWSHSLGDLSANLPNHFVQSRFRLKKVESFEAYFEPSENATLFYPNNLLQVHALSNHANWLVYQRSSGEMRFAVPSHRTLKASIKYAEPVPLGGQLKQSVGEQQRLNQELLGSNERYSLNENLWSAYLQTPADMEAVNSWMAKLKIDPLGANIEVVLNQIKVDFLKHFKATLLNEFKYENTLASFLLHDRRGHCEYFSTASVLALRAQGIPARIVTGYRGGDYNSLAGILEVRERNAHAWVEYFVPGFGWQLFDPTPIAWERTGASFGDYLGQYLGAMQFWFQKYVVDYGAFTQFEILRSWTLGFSQNKEDDENSTSDWPWVFYVELAVAAFAIWFILWWASRRFHLYRSMSHYPGYYRDFLTKLELAGIHKRRYESIRAFHERILRQHSKKLKARGVSATRLEELGEAVEIDLYAPYGIPRELRKYLKKSVRRIKG